ncbi:hypothetical protein ACWGTI_30295 [Mesorhizobium sp. ArgA1]
MHDIPVPDLKALAAAFSAWSGESYLLAAGWSEYDSRHPSEWGWLFSIAVDLIEQLRENASGYDFERSFGGGTAMMIQIGHREAIIFS